METRTEEQENPLFEQRLNNALDGLEPYFYDHLKNRISKSNAQTIVDYAILTTTDFSGAYLTGANLKFVDLTIADLSHCILRNISEFSDMQCTKSNLNGTDIDNQILVKFFKIGGAINVPSASRSGIIEIDRIKD